MSRVLIAACVLAGVVSGAGTAVGMRRLHPPPRMVSLQVDQLIREHVLAITQLDVDEAKRRQLADHFGRSLERELAVVSDGGRVTILSSAAVVKGVPDVTEQVREALRRELRETGP